MVQAGGVTRRQPGNRTRHKAQGRLWRNTTGRPQVGGGGEGTWDPERVLGGVT